MFDLSPTRLRTLMAAFPTLRIGVVGDFFLDSYRECDPALDEKSLETGKTCYQVIGYRRQPGAAGNVAANLHTLGVGAVEAVGYCGDDGEGYELRRAMRRLGLDLTGFLTAPGRLTRPMTSPATSIEASAAAPSSRNWSDSTPKTVAQPLSASSTPSSPTSASA